MGRRNSFRELAVENNIEWKDMKHLMGIGNQTGGCDIRLSLGLAVP
jgi:hypothetical protein